ncbi:MAG: tryptophan synthase subunit alpha [Ilumatobacteraceae bacterium]
MARDSGYPGWQDAVRAAAASRADAIEIGLPSRSWTDRSSGASEVALRRHTGEHPRRRERSRRRDPLTVMCYYNTVFRAGHERFAEQLVAAGIAGAIVPDLPLSVGPWCVRPTGQDRDRDARRADVPDERLPGLRTGPRLRVFGRSAQVTGARCAGVDNGLRSPCGSRP